MKAFAGIDIGGTGVKLGIVSGRRVLARASFPTASISSGSKALEEGILSSVRALAASCGVKPAAAGVGVPGLVLFPRGVVMTCANVRGWKDVPLQARLRRRLGVPVLVDNDVHAMALAEWRYGAGRGARNLVCLTLGTGVGGGFILDGRLYRSRLGPSAEIGHVAVGEEGPACSCGGRACLERYVGNRDVIRLLKAKLKGGRKSLILKLAGGEPDRITPEMIDRACEKGDRLAIETWTEAGRKIGLVLSKVITLLAPDRVVIGGGISKAGRWLFDPVRKTLRERCVTSLNRTPVVPAKLGTDAGIVGAALLGQEALGE